MTFSWSPFLHADELPVGDSQRGLAVKCIDVLKSNILVQKLKAYGREVKESRFYNRVLFKDAIEDIRGQGFLHPATEIDPNSWWQMYLTRPYEAPFKAAADKLLKTKNSGYKLTPLKTFSYNLMDRWVELISRTAVNQKKTTTLPVKMVTSVVILMLAYNALVVEPFNESIEEHFETLVAQNEESYAALVQSDFRYIAIKEGLSTGLIDNKAQALLQAAIQVEAYKVYFQHRADGKIVPSELSAEDELSLFYQHPLFLRQILELEDRGYLDGDISESLEDPNKAKVIDAYFKARHRQIVKGQLLDQIIIDAGFQRSLKVDQFSSPPKEGDYNYTHWLEIKNDRFIPQLLQLFRQEFRGVLSFKESLVELKSIIQQYFFIQWQYAASEARGKQDHDFIDDDGTPLKMDDIGQIMVEVTREDLESRQKQRVELD